MDSRLRGSIPCVLSHSALGADGRRAAGNIGKRVRPKASSGCPSTGIRRLNCERIAGHTG